MHYANSCGINILIMYVLNNVSLQASKQPPPDCKISLPLHLFWYFIISNWRFLLWVEQFWWPGYMRWIHNSLLLVLFWILCSFLFVVLLDTVVNVFIVYIFFFNFLSEKTRLPRCSNNMSITVMELCNNLNVGGSRSWLWKLKLTSRHVVEYTLLWFMFC